MIFRLYKNFVIEGKELIVLSALYAIISRLIHLFPLDRLADNSVPVGFLSGIIAPLLPHVNILTSFFLASFFLFLIASIAYYINANHSFIRVRTLLPSAFSILAFSFSPSLFNWSFYYISATTILIIISILFSSFNTNYAQKGAFSSGFMLAFASLFDVSLLFYYPFLWFALIAMRSLNFKAFLANLLSLVLVYSPWCVYYMSSGRLTLVNISDTLDNIIKIPDINQFATTDWVILGSIALIISIAIINSNIYSYRDKIKNRAYLVVLLVLLIYSILMYLFIDINSSSGIYIGLTVGSLVLAHFFATAEESWKAILFLICMLGYVTLCYISV